MRDLRPLIAAICASLVLGTVVVTRAVLIGVLEGGAELVDPNLGTALARPLSMHAATICVAAALVQAVVLVPAAPRGAHSTFALMLLATACLERAWIGPAMYGAWARVDRLTGQPATRLEDATAAALQHDGILLAMGTLAVVSIWLSLRAAEVGPGSRFPSRHPGSKEATPHHEHDPRQG